MAEHMNNRSYFILLFSILLYTSCKEVGNSNPCSGFIPIKNKTTLQISESLYDTVFLTPDTVIAESPTYFNFKYPYKATSLYDVQWDINNGSYTTNRGSFVLRFKDVGTYNIQLVVTYQPRDQCDTRNTFTDTVIKKLVVLPLDHSSILEGSYRGFLDTKPTDTFTITIKYWKHPGDVIGEYYLRNYVNGCAGDHINPQVPPGMGYAIITGFKNFNIITYPCNEPSDFKGFGYLNISGDSITIQHYGYNTAQYVPGDTIPHWHIFKGKRI
jgi:hypothetical protein